MDGDGNRALEVSARRRLLVALAAAVVAVAVVAAVGLLRSGTGANDRGEGPAPISLVDFDGDRFSLAEYRGTPVVVNFWASWCPSCAAEMPAFENVYQDVKGDVGFVGINNNDERSAAERLASDTGVTYRLAEDPGGEAFAAFGGTGMPTTVFINGDGRVVETVAGALSEDQLAALIEEHLGVAP